MAATKMFFITWFSSSTHLKVFRFGFGYAGFSDLEDVWDVFRSGFGYAGFSDLEDVWDDLPVSCLKYNALDDFQEVFQTTSMKSSKRVVWKTSWKSYDGVFSHVSPFHNISERFAGSLPDGFQEVVWISWKSSGEVFFHIKWSPSLSLYRNDL
uniref:Uncharacterized protein n=1 Tax=Brassica oleracea var. oleracea TaxID=109376 RepID=A0A0D3AS46_BRAOL